MAGRPTDYKEEYNLQAEKLCKLGATDKELADFFEIVESTLNEWKLRYPEFSESIKKGKTLADAEVAEKLYHRAIGYEHPDCEIKILDGQIVTVPLVKHYPPDSVAAIFWLKNRQKKKWRDKIEQGFTNENGEDVNPVMIFKIPDNGRDAGNTASEGLSGESSL
jgi:hypothetical protein